MYFNFQLDRKTFIQFLFNDTLLFQCFLRKENEEYLMFFHQGKQYWEQQKLFIWSIEKMFLCS